MDSLHLLIQFLAHLLFHLLGCFVDNILQLPFDSFNYINHAILFFGDSLWDFVVDLMAKILHLLLDLANSVPESLALSLSFLDLVQ